MRGILNIRMLSVRAALLPVLAAGLMLPSAHAQSANQNQKSDNKASGSSQAQAPSASSKAAEKETAPANKEHAGGPQEGIKVHGHWVIDVRNPDGKLVTHREFENAYNPSPFLSLIFARQNSLGFWYVYLDGGTRGYLLSEPHDCPTCDSVNLAISANNGAFVISGSLTAAAADNIQGVKTEGTACPPSYPPATPCQNGAAVYILTDTVLSSPIPFGAGQVVQVTVTISFSPDEPHKPEGQVFQRR